MTRLGATIDGSTAAGRELTRRPLETLARRPSALPGRPPGAFASLLDNLRAEIGRTKPPGALCIVLAGASGHEEIGSVSAGLVQQASDRGLRALVLTLTDGGSELSPVGSLEPDGPDPERRRSEPSAETIHSPRSLRLERWLEETGRSHDLVLVEAPDLGGSVEGAFLAQSCDGLVLVVEGERTPRASVSAAVKRIASVGCPVLGLVVTGAREWLPRPLKKLLSEFLG